MAVRPIRALRFGLLVLAGFLPAALFAQSPLALSWDSAPPAVDGVSPGGSVAFLAVARVPLGDSQRVHLVRQVAQAGAGETRVLVPWTGSAVPPRSIWAAVDESTGAFVLGSPSEELIPMPTRTALAEGTGGVALADHWLEVLLVRPGGGHWGGTVIDGSPSDRDGQADGKIELDPASLQPLADAPTLAAWVAGDVLITIDLDTFEVSTFVVGGAL